MNLKRTLGIYKGISHRESKEDKIAVSWNSLLKKLCFYNNQSLMFLKSSSIGFLIIVIFISTNISIYSKSKIAKRGLILPQFPNNSGGSNQIPIPGLNPLFYYNPAYQNFILNQNNLNSINSSLPQPQSDLGIQYLDKHIQNEIKGELVTQPIQSGNDFPVYRITNIIDHGREGKSKDSKYKNVDFLLWRFQSLEEGVVVRLDESKIELGESEVFLDKPKDLIKFIANKKGQILLIEKREQHSLAGLLVDTKTKKVKKVECSKAENQSREVYNVLVLSEELDFWNYITLFEKK